MGVFSFPSGLSFTLVLQPSALICGWSSRNRACEGSTWTSLLQRSIAAKNLCIYISLVGCVNIYTFFTKTAVPGKIGNLNFARRSASWAWILLLSLHLTDSKTWPMLTRAQTPRGFPKAPRIPVCRRSAPAHDSILLIRRTW